ncbi:MAG: DUF3256 family protein [Bacteroidaceae bacterium]|nr:DUF3256 family protein [Bacteroidaceae bacterium]MBR6845978.1 DUF3256 family protein [Bacteroidaceae bacterium]
MKRILLFSILVFAAAAVCHAQKMSEVFASAPYDVLPLMTRNNRLDCIDFIENNMEARVKDRFDNDVVLEEMTADYLRLVTSKVSSTEMKIVDGRVYVSETCMGPAADTQVKVYDSKWNLIKVVSRPEVEAFIRTDAKLGADERVLLIAEAKILTLIKGSLSKTDNTLTWELQTDEFTRDMKKAADKCLQPVVVRL